MTTPTLPPDVFDRYLAGQATADDAPLIAAWLATYPAAAQSAQAVRAARVGEPLSADELDRLWQRVQVTSPSPAIRRSRPFRVGLASLGAIAAAGLIMIFVRTGSEAVPEIATFTTRTGQQDTVVLPNGARVILGSASTLRYASQRGDRASVAELTGEALFSVAHDHRAPFSVRAGRVVTHVLGTAFVVRRYPNEARTNIVVTEGRVSVGLWNDRTSVTNDAVLSAGMHAAVNDSGEVRVTRDVLADQYTALVSGRLEFRQAFVRDIVSELARSYGAPILLADSALGNRRLTFTADIGRNTLDVVLHALSRALDAHVTQRDSVLTIVPGRNAVKSRIRTSILAQESEYGK